MIVFDSPEMVENKEFDEKADIWSFGCLVYELITMKPAFMAPNPLLLAKSICTCQYERIKMEGTTF